MQIVSIGDNLHEMFKSVFWRKKKLEKYFKMSAESFTKSAKHWIYIINLFVCWISPESDIS